jgi:hypothetical protein
MADAGLHLGSFGFPAVAASRSAEEHTTAVMRGAGDGNTGRIWDKSRQLFLDLDIMCRSFAGVNLLIKDIDSQRAAVADTLRRSTRLGAKETVIVKARLDLQSFTNLACRYTKEPYLLRIEIAGDGLCAYNAVCMYSFLRDSIAKTMTPQADQRAAVLFDYGATVIVNGLNSIHVTGELYGHIIQEWRCGTGRAHCYV